MVVVDAVDVVALVAVVDASMVADVVALVVV